MNTMRRGVIGVTGGIACLACAVLASSAVGCGGSDAAKAPATAPAPEAKAPDAGAQAANADPLGPRPELKMPSPFTPPVPVSYKRENGMTVWLLERHALPIVSIQMVVPSGSAEDPKGKGGLAWATANMLDEGAGKRGALQISSDVDRLGATLHTGAFGDYAFAELTALKKNIGPAMAIFGDVLAKPTFAAADWKRVHDLWTNDLRARQRDPNAVARVVTASRLFGVDQPYAHPTNGTLASAGKVQLADVKSFYGAFWRPERATCVVVGDVTRAEVDALLDQALGEWKNAPAPAASARADTPAPQGRQVVIVDRPDAPQSVITVARRGVEAKNPDAGPLVRVNGALGGSFTSRLNQDLREEHGWSYGAHSRFSFNKLPGMFAAEAAVHTEHTGEALKAMLADVEALAKGGLTDEEVIKTRLLARADLVEAYEGASAAARRLARNAGVGLAPDQEAKASARLYDASKEELAKLAAQYIDVTNGVIVIVGPRAKLEPQLKAIGITTIVASGPEGD